MFNLHEICKTANVLYKSGYSRSKAFAFAWAMAKGTTTKVKGVTHERRQEALLHLLRYNPDDVSIQLHRESDNLYDGNAIAVVAAVQGHGAYKMGYLPRNMSAVIAPLMDAGKAIQSLYKEVRGGYTEYCNYGLVIQIRI